MSSRPSSPGLTLLFVVGTLVGAGVGFLLMNHYLGGLMGALAGMVVSVFPYVLLRARSSTSAPVGVVPSLDLPADKMANLLVAAHRSGESAALGSEVLTRIAELRELSETDLEGAIESAKKLAGDFRVAPAVPYELAQLYDRAQNPQAALKARWKAISLAVNGGMNAIAVRTFLELPAELPADQQKCPLPQAQLDRLAKVLQARGESVASARCRALEGDAPAA